MSTDDIVKIVGAIVTVMTATGALYASRWGARTSHQQQIAATKLEADRDEFARMKVMLDEERAGRARDVTYEQASRSRLDVAVLREQKDNDRLRARLAERDASILELTQVTHDLARALHKDVVALASLDVANVITLPPPPLPPA